MLLSKYIVVMTEMVEYKYDNTIILHYVKHFTDFLYSVQKSDFANQNDKNKNVYQGCKTMLHVLSFFYLLKVSENQISSYLEKSYILYNEYTDQVYKKNSEPVHTPLLFVYNVLIGNINFKEYLKYEKESAIDIEDVPFVKKLSVWQEILMFWKNKCLHLDNRIHIVDNFLKSYLIIFSTKEKFHLYRIFILIQDYLQNVNFDVYTFFLTSFNNYFSENNRCFSKEKVQEICLQKMFIKKDEFDEKLKQATSLNQMNLFVTWLFSD